MKTKMLLIAVMASAGTVLTAPSATAQQILYGHVPETVARLHLRPIGRLPATNRLHLAIGLPFRNKEALTNLLQQLFDPEAPITVTILHRNNSQMPLNLRNRIIRPSSISLKQTAWR